MGAEASSTSTDSSASTANPQVAPTDTTANASAEVGSPERPSPDDDPEIDLGEELGKVKRSQLREQAKRRRDYDRAASMRFDEAAKARKEVDAREAELREIANAFKTKPEAFFEKFGLNPDEWAERRLTKSLERAKMSPEAIELEQARERETQLRKQIETHEQKAAREKQDAVTQKWVDHYDKEIGAAFSQTELPRTEYAVNRVLDVFERFGESGEDIPTSLAVEIAQDGMMEDTRQLLAPMAKSPAKLVAFLGDDICNAIAKHRVEKAQAVQKPQQPQSPQVRKPSPKQGAPTFEDVRKQLKF